MSLWRCAIGDCSTRFEDVESAIVHQTNDHERHECQVCGTIVPEGYFAPSTVSHGGVFQFSPRREAIKSTILAAGFRARVNPLGYLMIERTGA